MKRLVLLLPLLALAAAPAAAETYGGSGRDIKVTPKNEERYGIWTRTQRYVWGYDDDPTPDTVPDTVEFTIVVPRTIDGATFVEALFILANEKGPGPDPESDPFTAAHTRMAADPGGSGLFEFSLSCATQWLDRASVLVRYDPDFEEHDRGAWFDELDTDNYILRLDRFAADPAWRRQCDAVLSAVKTPKVRELLAATKRLYSPYDVSGADTAHRIGKIAAELEALHAAAAPSNTAFHAAVTALGRRCRACLADEDVRAAADELARGILPAGVHTNAELAVEFEIRKGEATIRNDLSPGRSRETLEIPETLGGRPVVKIGYAAFKDCRALRSVALPASVRYVGMAFSGCTSLTNVVLGSGVERLVDPFYGCDALESIELGAALSWANGWSFPAAAPRLRLRLDPANPHFKLVDGALCSADGKTLVFAPAPTGPSIPPGVTAIGPGAIREVPAADPRLVVPDGVESIGYACFSRTAGLREVVLPDSVRNIDFSAFTECPDLETVVIGAGVTNIGSSAFANCPKLATVRIAAKNVTMVANAFRTRDGKAPAVFEVGGVPSQPPAYMPDDEDEDWEDCDDPDSDDEDLGDGDEDWDEDEDFDDEDFDEDDDDDDDEIDE